MTELLSDYQIRQALYQSERTTVYRATERQSGQSVILKLLSRPRPSPRDVARFQREIEITDALRGEHFVEVLDVERTDKGFMIVFEDVGGESLDKTLEKRRFDLETFLHLAMKICEALAHLHRQNIVHKDINPSNIIWNPDTEQVKLIDFGLSTRRRREYPDTEPPIRTVGTLPYISPEQTGRIGRTIDYRTDFYSLGVTLYELWSGRLPFDSDDAAEVIHHHLARMPPPLETKRSDTPTPLSKIISKLMSKAAEKRYQHADGLYADLDRCLRQWQKDNKISDFELGLHDIHDRLELPQQLFGRDDELAVLQSDFRKCERGERRLRLISGPPGVGKSALLDQFLTLIPATSTRFAMGAFEPGQSAPYGAFGKILDNLVVDLLSQDDEKSLRRRHKIRKVLEDDISLIADIVPSLHHLLEESPPEPTMDVHEARHRFRDALRRFVALLCKFTRPLVLILDDLQWADPTTLELLEWLLCGEELNYLLVIGTYRTEEMDPGHPVLEWKRSLRSHFQQVETINLEPLDRFSIRAYVAAALHEDPDDVALLADIVFEKTGGTPYFAGQFLTDITRRSLLWFDADVRRWRWNSEALQAMPVTENVVELLSRGLEAIDKKTLELLQYAALMGRRFSLHDLIPLCALPDTEILHRLEPALERELVLPLSEPVATDSHRSHTTATLTEFAFPHDRVRQAFAQQYDDEERKGAHLRIARHLRSQLDDNASPPSLFSAVKHYQEALDLIDDPEERIDVANLLTKAGTQALNIPAPASAARNFESATQLLDRHHWESDPGLMRTVYAHRARVESMLGRDHTAEELARIGLSHVEDPAARVPFYIVLIGQQTRRADFDDALSTARKALQPFGLSLPLDNVEDALFRELTHIEEQLTGRNLEELDQIPVVVDEEADAALDLLSSLHPLAGVLDRRLLWLIGLQGTSITLKVGIRPQSVTGLATYGATLCMAGDYARGYQVGRLALERAREFANQSHLAHTTFIFATFIMPWCRHLSESIPVFEEGFRAARRSGNQLFSGYHILFHAFHLFFLGRELHRVSHEIARCIDLGKKIGHQVAEDAGHSYQILLRNLKGDTDSLHDFSSPDFPSPRALIEHCKARGNDVTVAAFRITYAQILYLYGDSKKALEELRKSKKAHHLLQGTFSYVRQFFWQALSIIDVAVHTEDEEERSHLRSSLEPLREELARLKEQCPENFLHKSLLVDAETARLDGDVESAMHLYDEAIAEARSADFFHLEALANERAGLFWEAHGKRDFSLLYLSDARDGYRLWRATPKVELLEEHHDLKGLHTDSDTSLSSSDTSSHDSIDVISVFKSSELIASRLELDELLPTLLQVTLENAGAQRGAFIASENGALYVSVEGEVDEEPVRHPERSYSLKDWSDGAHSIVHYVCRTGEPVVIGKAVQEPRFRTDPYIKRHRPRSILCIPVAEHDHLRGVLYVENNLVDDAFTEERVRVLEVLAGHIAVALSKARLYTELHEEKERFRQLAENIQEVFWLMDWPSKTIIYVSPAYKIVWGRPVPEEPLSIEKWLEPVCGESRSDVGKSLAEDAIHGDYDEIYQVEHPDGSYRWIRDRGFPIRNRDGEVFRIAGVAMDITAEREVSKMKDELLSVVSHELRTPLTPIIGVFSMLDENIGDMLPEEAGEMVHLGLRNSRRLLRLVDDLLDVQRLSRGKMHFDLEVFDLRELATEAVRFQQPIAEARDIDLLFHNWPHQLPIEADRDRLLQVIRNLLSNAIKFSERGDTVEIELRRLDNNTQLAVTDHGPGIPGDLRDQIFEKFTQADSSLTRRHGGTGLGLAIAHSIVENLGGEIFFDTELGEGTTFYVELPIHD